MACAAEHLPPVRRIKPSGMDKSTQAKGPELATRRAGAHRAGAAANSTD